MDKGSHIIINVGRQIGSGGHDVARRLADLFGCKFYDREILNIAAKESGFSEKFFEQNDEHKTFFKSLFNIHTSLLSDNSIYKSDFSQEGLFSFQSEAIRKAAQEGPCVFVGRCADYILRDFPNSTNIFLTADLIDRVKAVSERRCCTEKEARKFISTHESQRSTYYNFYTGKQWGHSESYDLTLNTSSIGIDGAVEMVEKFVGMRRGVRR